MLPSVSKKIEESSKSSSSKKKEKKSKKSKKSSKKHKKERKKSKKKKRSASSDSDDSSAEERLSKKKHKRKHFSDASSESSSSSNESDEEDEWVEKGSENKAKIDTDSKIIKEQAPVEREDWLGGLSSIRTFSKPAQDDSKERKKDERKGLDSYDPGKSVRELNPHWRDGGDGLPKAFAKPSYDSDEEDSRRPYRPKQNERERSSNWKKRTEHPNAASSTVTSSKGSTSSRTHRKSSSSSSASSRSPTPEPKPTEQDKSQASRGDFLTDHQMNELGAKLIKAEMLGKNELASELKEKLDRARQFRKEHKQEVLSKSFERRTQGAHQHNKREKEANIVLTATNSKGQSRPVASFRDDSDLWGGRAGRKVKKQKVETHLDGERVRYFADDDKYDIKRMVSDSTTSFNLITSFKSI